MFDAIFVCNGHNSVPFTPDFQGINEFQGRVIHSHDYRRAESFKGYHSYRIDVVSGSNELLNFPDKNVLIVGAGPSGVDLTHALAAHAKRVIFSHHSHNLSHFYPSNVIRKGSIQRFTRNSVVFADGIEIDITDIVYCTGNIYIFDFNLHFFFSLNFFYVRF